jgi:hypothetical protein
MKFLCLLLLPVFAFSLEIDSKLTLRIVKVSSSQKTILINRGVEDGLEKNNHAKFYLSTGVVARGVTVKVSPTRSVWSLYRIVNNNYIVNDQVLKLKITPELKISKDESRSLVSDDQTAVLSSNPRDLGIPLADGADDMDAKDVANTKSDMKELDWANSSNVSKQSNKKIALGLSGSFNTSSSSTKRTGKEYTGADSKVNFDMSLEYYMLSLAGKLSNLSVRFIYSINDSSTIAYDGTTTQESINEYGGGLSYHFKSTKDVSVINPFIDSSFLVGTVASSFTPGDNTVSSSKTSVKGSSSYISVGAGLKYLSSYGLGFRAKVDYFSRSLKYSPESVGANEYNKSQSGPKITFGASYRF